MTREQFRELQTLALENLKADIQEHQRNPMILAEMRDELERQYQAVLHKQADWARGGFWTQENERKYEEKYKGMEKP